MNLKKLIKVKDSNSDFVGAQDFTYLELKRAFDEVKALVGEPQEGYEFYFYSFVDGMGDLFVDFNYNALADALAKVPTKLEVVRLEVWHCDETGDDEASEGHEIIIIDGKTLRVE